MKLHPEAKQISSSNKDALSLTEQQKFLSAHQANKKCRTHIGAVSKQFKSEINLKPEPILDIFDKSASSQGEGLVKLSIPSEVSCLINCQIVHQLHLSVDGITVLCKSSFRILKLRPCSFVKPSSCRIITFIYEIS
jgi:hypothetical protein